MRTGHIIIPLVLLLVVVFYWLYSPGISEPNEEGISTELMDSAQLTSEEMLVEAEGVLLIRSFCTGCHSEKLITQNRATRDGWESMIRWMQKTQNLGDLGTSESAILDYLAKNYSPVRKGRRLALEVEWYELPN
jgi:hypothetical protein